MENGKKPCKNVPFKTTFLYACFKRLQLFFLNITVFLSNLAHQRDSNVPYRDPTVSVTKLWSRTKANSNRRSYAIEQDLVSFKDRAKPYRIKEIMNNFDEPWRLSTRSWYSKASEFYTGSRKMESYIDEDIASTMSFISLVWIFKIGRF